MSNYDQNFSYCCICREKYPPKTLYCCYNNHYFCSKCYKKEYYKGKEKRCPQRYCYSWVSVASDAGLNAVDERAPRKMIPFPGLISEKKKVEAQRSSLLIRSFTSVTSLSRRPVNCPYNLCNKSVAVTAFDAHFKYEHPDVPIITTNFDGNNGLELHPNEVKYSEKLCIVLVNVINSAQEQNTNIDDKRSVMSTMSSITASVKPTLVLLATRIPCYDLDNEEDEEEEILNDYGDAKSSSDIDACTPEDKIIIWLASNIQTKNSYSVAASNPNNNYRFKYFGPIETLNEKNARKIFEEGKCLILSHNQFMGMTENGQKYFIVNFVVHGEA